MATYKGVKGFTIQTIAGDPPAPVTGQVWYNTTSNVLKGYAPVTGAWAAGNNVLVGRGQVAGAGIQTAALLFGGINYTQSPGPATNLSETYDGTSWSEGNNMNQGRYGHGGCGVATAALAITGYQPPPRLLQVEAYNGSSWVEGNDVNTARSDVAAAGTTAAAIVFGGSSPGGLTDLTENWNGTSWSEVSALPAGRSSMAGLGISTAALAVSGSLPSTTATVGTWNGSTWTLTNNVLTGRRGSAATGISTAGMFFNAYQPAVAFTEQYDGTCWSEVGDMTVQRGFLGGATSSPNTATLGFTGGDPTRSLSTEEWNSGPAVVTFTSS